MNKKAKVTNFFFTAIFLIAGCGNGASTKADGDAQEGVDVTQDDSTVNVEGDIIPENGEEIPQELPPDTVDTLPDTCTGPGMMICNGVCVDTNTDPQHCGNCDTMCTRTLPICVDGTCTDRCPGTLTNCDGKCVDLMTDPQNCGDCGNECAPGGICNSGTCACLPGLVYCADDNVCADLSSDTQHCGSCDRRCPADAACISGNCQCPPGTERCGDTCADLQTDPLHCGDCGTSCGRLGTCVAGECGDCVEGATNCWDSCVDTNTDPRNCGGCMVECRSSAQVCVGGDCECRFGLQNCNGMCVDTDFDSRNCGRCGNECGFGRRCYQGNCITGNCEDQTPPAVTCEGPGGSRYCIQESEFQTDPLNCGECGRRCNAGEVCVAGDCASFIAGFGCTTCPCDFCLPRETCCVYPGSSPDFIICVEGTSCP